MRFPQLKIGQQFEYQGKRYTKTGPLTATEEATGASAMIRRSADVTLVDRVADEALVEQVKQNYSRDEAIELCREYRIKLTQELQSRTDENGRLQIDSVITTISRLDPFDSR